MNDFDTVIVKRKRGRPLKYSRYSLEKIAGMVGVSIPTVLYFFRGSSYKRKFDALDFKMKEFIREQGFSYENRFLLCSKYKLREISEKMNIPLSTVWRYLHKERRRVRGMKKDAVKKIEEVLKGVIDGKI